ncbi:MAG: sensor histidine kinase [Acidimicrobiales bacterium]
MSYGLYAYGLAGGGSLMIAALFFLLALQRPSIRDVQLSIAVLGVAGAAATLVHVQLQTARDVEQYAAIIKGPFALVGLLVLVAFVWAVGAQTKVAYPRVPIALSLATLAVGAVNLALPNGLLVGEVTGLREVTLFGDQFVLHEPSRSPWRIVLDVYLLAVIAYTVVAIVVRVRQARRSQFSGSVFTLAGLGLLLAFGMYDSLVDEAIVGTPYLAPFGVVGLVVGLVLAHAERVAETERQLLAHSIQLEAIVTERTSALAEAHKRVVDQLDHQRQAAEDLARITHEFVVLNSVGLAPGSDAGLERAVEGVIGCVGEVAYADDVRLELDRSVASSSGLSAVNWRAPSSHDAQTSSHSTTSRILQIGDLRLGSLTITWTTEPDLSDQQVQLIGLATDYLATVLHRLDIQSSLVVVAVDSERQRIAQELHDSVSQRLYAAAFNAESLAARGFDDPAAAGEQAREIRTLVVIAIAEMRTLLFELQPKIFETSSLEGLLDSLCKSIGASPDRPIALVAQAGPPIPPGPKLALYRIAQEALGNALRHAEASSIRVLVDIDEDGVLLGVEDDGLGFDPEDVAVGYGLRNMTERAARIGSELEVTSSRGHGTSVSVRWAFATTMDSADVETGTVAF